MLEGSWKLVEGCKLPRSAHESESKLEMDMA